MSIACRTLSLFFALLLLASVAQGSEVGGQLKGELLWQGEVFLPQTLKVEAGEVLTIAPGTVVRPLSAGAKLIVAGTLKVQGTSSAPVIFAAPDGWQGIEFINGGEGSALDYALFSKAAIALSSDATGFTMRHCTIEDGGTGVKLIREADPLIEDNHFTGNNIGIVSEMKSAATIRRNQFSGHKTSAILLSYGSIGAIEGNTFDKNKQGIGVLQKYNDHISDNLFSANEVGIYLNQTQNTPLISHNRFVDNRHALTNFSFAAPEVKGNAFVGNEIGIRNDQFSSAHVYLNHFKGNQTAIYNYRKSNPLIENNLLEQNDLVLFCDYSSYPIVHQNNFSHNLMVAKLGVYQSGDWEKRHGSKDIMQKEAASHKGPKPRLALDSTEVSETIDISNNWWGEDTVKLQSAGKDGNLAMFHDRRDQPRVFYEGFAAEGYVFDLIQFAPWLSAPVADTGPVR